MKDDRTELKERLKEIPIFSGLEDDDIVPLAEGAVRRSFGKGEAVIREKDTTTSMYILLTGRARAVTNGPGGRPHTHNTFQPGDYFGEMSFIDGEPRSATVEMTEDGAALEIGGDQLARLAARPDILLRFMKGMSRKLRTATQQIEDMETAIGVTELHDAHTETIRRLVLAAECKDDNTADHIVRVSRYSALIARQMGCDEREVANICYAAPMHDIGKIGVPKYILWKPGPLDNPRTDILAYGRRIALHHHEKFNGGGYPFGLCGDAIPLEARIVGLVDAFDAIVSSRPYKFSVPMEAAMDIIWKDRGTHFDPKVAEVFMDSREAVKAILGESDEGTCNGPSSWPGRRRRPSGAVNLRPAPRLRRFLRQSGARPARRGASNGS